MHHNLLWGGIAWFSFSEQPGSCRCLVQTMITISRLDLGTCTSVLFGSNDSSIQLPNSILKENIYLEQEFFRINIIIIIIINQSELCVCLSLRPTFLWVWGRTWLLSWASFSFDLLPLQIPPHPLFPCRRLAAERFRLWAPWPGKNRACIFGNKIWDPRS